jgi:hypothetical protein
MNSSQIPAKFPIPWGNSAGPSYIRPIPTAASSTLGYASLDTGFPPANFIDPLSGGVSFFGEDMNGILQQLSACSRWIQAGGVFQRDATFQAAIGGYPLGAILKAASYSAFWVSTAENNTVNPDTGTLTSPATGWSVLQPGTYPWSQITGAPSFVLNSAFTGANQSIAVNGYQKFPGGMIEQWCETSSGPSTIITISYPIAFPTASFTPRVSATNPSATSGGANNFVGATVISHTLSNCLVAIGAIPVGSTTSILLNVRGK